MGRTKDAAAEKVHYVEEEASEAAEKVKDTVTHSAHRASDKARESKENVKESAREARDKVSEKAGEMKEGAADRAERTKGYVSEKAEEAEEMVEDASERVEQGALSLFLRARAVVSRVLAFLIPPVSLASVSGVLHLLGFTAAYGMCIWVTFASSYVLALALPRHQFAMVQSKIYPVYFKAMAYSVGIALFGHLLNHWRRMSPLSVGMFQASNLVVALVMVLVNLLYLEPRATKVMFERMKMEKEEGRGKESVDTEEPSGPAVDPTIETLVARGATSSTADEKQKEAEMARMSEVLRRLNSYSSFLNVLTLMSLTCHLVYLGQRLHIQC
ncbi:hypothetical protein F511_05973 [Dorcoceras hygrometricum]|uniref:TMEM205-like domain-containing protein n=1 Tax=Dorcoceras hygrometricum TaxID=472368 RepID=A0A2Z7DB94_9LAMI|nr:hypothetical protein F511_05973 [Dorcoceras hygrometricum]